jgi:hypothetical protein
MMTTTYLDMAAIGEWFGVSAAAVSQWRTRYADTHPCPEPDVLVGRTPGWSAERRPEWVAWHAARPGQGTGGGRPRAVKP